MLSKDLVYYVYLLIDPRASRVFYVGKASGKERGDRRLTDHIGEARRGEKSPKYDYIREMLAAGVEPVLVRVEERLTEEDAYDLEIILIRRIGRGNLTNVDKGGYGGPSVPAGDDHWTRRRPELISWTGDDHYLRKCPERKEAISGDNHWTRRHPEKVLRGDQHPSRTKPESRPRGERHGRHTKPEATARGARHGCAKLTEQQVDELRRIYTESRQPERTPITGKALAKQFGVTPTQISRILKGGWGKPNLLPHHGNRHCATPKPAALATTAP